VCSIEAAQIRRLLAENIKAYRKKRALSQEKLAELARLSLQTVNCIEGCRTWVSDKTLGKLADALHIEVFQLFGPPEPSKNGRDNADLALELRLHCLQEELKHDIDSRFHTLRLCVKESSNNPLAETPEPPDR
jgi:transcriptional regulator with XRE-family HTH domain